MLVLIAFMILGTLGLGLVGVAALWRGPVGFGWPAARPFYGRPWGWRLFRPRLFGPPLFNPRLFRPRLFGPPLFGPRVRWGRGGRRW